MTAPPRLVIVGGPNGSGKSTFTARFLKQADQELIPVNPDDIAREIDPVSPEKAAVKAGVAALKRIRDLYADRRDFLVETTLSGEFHLNLMRRAKADGWPVTLIFIYLPDPAMTLTRIATRVADGGHNIPEVDVYRRYGKSFRNLFRMVGVVDEIQVCDNSLDELDLIASSKEGNWYVLKPEAFEGLKGI